MGMAEVVMHPLMVGMQVVDMLKEVALDPEQEGVPHHKTPSVLALETSLVLVRG